MELHLDIDTSDSKSRQERIICAKYITETVDNMPTSIKTKRQVKYSAHTINVAMSLFLRNKKSYDALRKSGLLCLQHPTTLKKITKYMKVLTGGDPTIYLSLKDEISKLKHKVVGRIIMDEIKLKIG